MMPTEPPPTRTATVVVSGDDMFEDLFTAAVALQSLLTAEGFAARTALGTAVFEDAGARIAHDDLIVLYTAAGRFSAEGRRNLAQVVHDGAGLIAVHSTNLPGEALPDAGGDPLLDLIGSRYISHGPPPHESRFRVQLDAGHEVTAGIAPFDVTHEHYRIETTPDARILAWRRAEGHTEADTRIGTRARTETDAADRDEPLLHVRTHGAGRVCYLQLGHDLRIWGQPPVRRLVRQAARWACRGAVKGV
jgi:hypothetical protein